MKTNTTPFSKNLIKEVSIALLLLYGTSAHAQLLNINSGNGVTTNQLTDSLFDNNFTLSNVVESGDVLARGTFNNNGSNLPINKGIIISTGKAADAAGPNNQMYGANTAFSNANTPDNDLLSLVAANATFKDLYKIEVDAIPNVDTLIFTYSFGSEEYLTYAPPLDMSGAYNDVFGIFISGPGITGYQNVATIPGSNSNVSVFTINPVFNTLYFVNNLANLLLGIILPSSIQYNGFTKLMQIKVPVIQGQTYHIKIAIADMRDNIVDSGVFIKASGKKSGNIFLPVEMTNWNVENKGASNFLNWKTAMENNNSHFEVEKSRDGKVFKSIANILGHGTCSTTHIYNYEDATSIVGNSYYRLKQIDFNGNYTYSTVALVHGNETKLANDIEAYPNPANGNINIRLQATTNEQGTVEMLDLSGKKVFQQVIVLQEGSNELHCDISNLPHGAYFMRVLSNTINSPAQRIFN